MGGRNRGEGDKRPRKQGGREGDEGRGRVAVGGFVGGVTGDQARMAGSWGSGGERRRRGRGGIIVIAGRREDRKGVARGYDACKGRERHGARG